MESVMCGRFLQPVSLILILAASSLAPAARAETETELIDRKAALLLEHLSEYLDLIEDQWRKEFLSEELLGNDGLRLSDEAILKPLSLQQDKVRKALEGQKKNFASWQTGRSNARFVRSSAARFVQSAIEGAWIVAIQRAEFRVDAIAQAYNRRRKELSAERDRRLDALGKRYAAGSERWETAKARLEEAIAKKEEASAAAAVDRYGRASKDLAERRGILCRETWRWESFFENLNRKEEAKIFRILVYSQFAIDLADRSVGLHRDLFAYYSARDSRLDHFVRDPSSPDRLVLSGWLSGRPKRVYKMDPIVLRDPVESLKTEDGTEPPITVEGTPLEKLIHSLSAQLGRMFDLQKTQKSLTGHLRELNASHHRYDAVGLELAKLEQEFSSCTAVMERFVAREFDRVKLADELGRLEKEADAARDAADQARIALDEARESITIRRRIGHGGWELDDPATSRGRRAGARLAVLDGEIAKLKEQLKSFEEEIDHALQAEIALYARLVKEKLDEKGAIRSLIAGQLAPLEREMKSRRKAAVHAAGVARNARLQLDRLAKDGGAAAESPVLKETVESLDVDYLTFFEDSLVKKLLGLKPQSGRNPSLMNGAETPADYLRNLASAEDSLQEVRTRLTATLDTVKREMAHTFGKLASNDRKLMKLTARVTRLRSAAATIIALTARQLGADETDPFIETLDETKNVLDKLGSHMVLALWPILPASDAGGGIGSDATGKGMERIPLQKFLDLSMDSDALQWLAEGKSRITTLSDTMNILGIAHEPDAIDNTFGSVATALSIPGAMAEGVPVIGWALCFTLDFYGKTVEAIGKATGKIQEKLIAKNVAYLKDFKKDPALHMYTFDELKRETALDNDGDLRALTKTLQIARLCRLLHTRRLTDTKDKPLD